MAILKLTSSAARILSPQARSCAKWCEQGRNNSRRCQHGARSLASRYDKVVPVALLVLSSPKFILFPIRIPFYLSSASYINTS